MRFPRPSGDAMDDRLERKARNEALMREVNERIAEVDKAAEEASFAPEHNLFEFICECGGDGNSQSGCEEHIRMTIQEYEDVRSQDDRFAVYPGHEKEALEWVVMRKDRFVLVDKGPNAEPFVADDPRGAPSK
jgi:hypothetical protein